MNLIARLGVLLGLDNKDFIKGIDQATQKTREFEINTKRELKLAEKNFAAFQASVSRGMLGIAAAAAAIGSAFKYADEIEKTAKAYDVTVESLLALQQAFKLSGGESAMAGDALQKLAVAQQNAIDGSDSLRDAFKKLGISGKDVEQLALEDLFKRVAQELSNVENTTQRAALQQELLGKAVKGTNWKEFASNYKEMADPSLAQAIEENARAWGNIEDIFQGILNTIQKMVQPFAAMVNYIADIGNEWDRLKKGGGAEIDFGAAFGGMPGEAIVGQYYDAKRPNTKIAPAPKTGEYSTLSTKGKSDANKAAEEERRKAEARAQLQEEIKLIQRKADIAALMFNLDSKAITLGEKSVAQEKLQLDLANDIAVIRANAAKERSKDKAQVDLINKKEEAAIAARVQQYEYADALRQKNMQRAFALTIQTLDIEAEKSKEIAELEFTSQMDLLELEKEKFNVGENGYEQIKLFLDEQDKLQKLSLSYKQNLEAINTEFDRSAKSAEDLAIQQKKTNAENLAYLQAKERIEKQAEIAREILAIKQERDHAIVVKNIQTQTAARLFAIKTETENTKESLELERERYELGHQAYNLKKIDVEAGQQIERVLEETKIKAKEIVDEYNLTGKTLKDQELLGLRLNSLYKEEQALLNGIVKNQELKGVILKEQFELQQKLFTLDLAQQKGRDIANIQAQQKADKDRLGLEYRRYMLTQNQYNLQSLELDNVMRLIEAEKKYNDQKKEAKYEMERQGSTQEARENYEQIIKAIDEVRDIELQAIEDVNNARTRNAEADVARQKSFVEGWGYAARKFREDSENAFARGERAFGAVMSNMDAAISNFVETGKFAFEDFAVSVIKDLIRMEMQAQATMLFRMLIGSLGGFSMSNANFDAGIGGNIGMAATGGEISGPTIVGENGPELFIPSQRGTIIPNTIAPSMAGMGQPQMVINGPYIENMSAIDTQSGQQFLAKNKNTIWAAYQSANRTVPLSR